MLYTILHHNIFELCDVSSKKILFAKSPSNFLEVSFKIHIDMIVRIGDLLQYGLSVYHHVYLLIYHKVMIFHLRDLLILRSSIDSSSISNLKNSIKS